jgi:hypothetical protein
VLVQRPVERLDIVRQAHQDWGHFGVKRTLSLLTPTFWWHSMGEDVVHVVRSCEPCNRQKAVFNVRPQELHPLELCGMMYRVHIDLAGPLPDSGGVAERVLHLTRSLRVILSNVRFGDPVRHTRTKAAAPSQCFASQAVAGIGNNVRPASRHESITRAAQAQHFITSCTLRQLVHTAMWKTVWKAAPAAHP